MKKINLIEGDEILCIMDDTYRLILKGDVYTVSGFAQFPCCRTPIVNIGIRDFANANKCHKCNRIYKEKTGDIWFPASLFRKIKKTKVDDYGPLSDAFIERIKRYRESNNSYPFDRRTRHLLP